MHVPTENHKTQSKRSLKILRLLLSIGETSAPYNQFSLAWCDQHQLTLCPYFRSQISPPSSMKLIEGDGSVVGYLRALKTALTVQDYDIIHLHSPHVALLLLLATLLQARTIWPRTICTVHNSYQNIKFRNQLMWIPAFASCQAIVCCSQASFDSFPWLYRWLAGDRRHAIPNGVDLDRVDQIIGSASPSLDSASFTVITIGRLVAIKNLLLLLAAFQESGAQASRLILIGEGGLRSAIEAQSAAFNLEARVEITGLIPREQVYRHLVPADVYVSTSFGEGLPVATLEAMACHCPVILSDILPHREIAAGTDFIPLVPPEDGAGFAREIKRFRQMSVAERAEIGAKCRALVEARFSLSAMHQNYNQLYLQLLQDQDPYERVTVDEHRFS